jgi:Flp pilus assembly protein CpaB
MKMKKLIAIAGVAAVAGAVIYACKKAAEDEEFMKKVHKAMRPCDCCDCEDECECDCECECHDEEMVFVVEIPEGAEITDIEIAVEEIPAEEAPAEPVEAPAEEATEEVK